MTMTVSVARRNEPKATILADTFATRYIIKLNVFDGMTQRTRSYNTTQYNAIQYIKYKAIQRNE